MHIRWIKANSSGHSNGKGGSLDAILEASDSPEPRTAPSPPFCLGTIEERYLRVNVPRLRDFHQGLFWTAVDRNLDNLNIDSLSRNQIEQEIIRKVPRPSADWALWGVVCVPEYD